MPKVLAISNQKGGVGKTTTAINLSASLTLSQQKVLLIDLDPKGNSSQGIGLPQSENKLGISDVLQGHQDLMSIIKTVELAPQSLLYVAPVSCFQDSILEKLEHVPNKEHSLHQAIVELNEKAYFDYIIIDCPPALNLLTTIAFCAAKELILPIQAEYYALDGINDLLVFLQRAKQNMQSSIVLGNVLITMVSPNSLSLEIVDQVKIFFGIDYCFEQLIPRDYILAEATHHQRSIFQHKANSNGARAYFEIAKELQARHGTQKETSKTKSNAL